MSLTRLVGLFSVPLGSGNATFETSAEHPVIHTPSTESDPMHTTTSWHTCDCAPCRTRLRAYNRKWATDKRRNPAPRLTDCGPVAAHINALRATGMSYPQLAALTGYGRETLRDTATGRVQRVRTVMAEDILTIPLPTQDTAA